MSNRVFFFWIVACTLVYGFGLYLPLMDSDAAQFAGMARQMYETQDFLHLYKAGMPYLDKPHMHFWLACLSFSVFGAKVWVYRLHGLLFIGLAAYATYGIGKLLYGRTGGQVSSLFFLCAQAVFLMGHDLRTDAVLVGFTTLALWKLLTYIERRRWLDLMLGGVFLGLAFSTKGLISVVVCGTFLLVYLVSAKKWEVLRDYRVWLVGLASFVIASIPVLYAYSVQFGAEGVFFLFFDQSYERLSGGTWEQANPEYSFFWHTLLWACLPFSLILYYLWYANMVAWVRRRARWEPSREMMTSLGLLVIMVIIGLSQFKLPHYLNIVIPEFAVLAGGGLVYRLRQDSAKHGGLYGLQLFVAGVLFCACMAIVLWVFPLDVWKVFLVVLAFGLVFWYGIRTTAGASVLDRIVSLSVGAIVIANLVMNTVFYPRLLDYQSGVQLREYVQEHGLSIEEVRKYDMRVWLLDFDQGGWRPPIVSMDQLGRALAAKGEEMLILMREEDLADLPDYVRGHILTTFYHFHVTRLSFKFLNPESRQDVLDKVYLLRMTAVGE